MEKDFSGLHPLGGDILKYSEITNEEMGMRRRVLPGYELLVSLLLHALALVVLLPAGVVSLQKQGPRGITVYLSGKPDEKAPVLTSPVITEKLIPAVMKKKRSSVREHEKTPGVHAEPGPQNVAPESEAGTKDGMNEPSVHSSPGVESEETSSEEDIGAASFREPGHEEEYGTGRPYVAEFGGADGPRFLKKVTPSYPLMARRLGKEGRVLLRLLIDDTGTLLGIEVVDDAEYGFDRAAVEAVEKSTFLPAVKDGKSVVSQSLLSVIFVLTAE